MDDFYCLRMKAGLSREDCALLFKRNLRTIKAWELKGNTPVEVMLYLRLRSSDLSHISKDWSGFRIESDCIVNVEKDFIYPHEIRAIKYLYTASEVNRTRMHPQHRPPFERIGAVDKDLRSKPLITRELVKG